MIDNIDSSIAFVVNPLKKTIYSHVASDGNIGNIESKNCLVLDLNDLLPDIVDSRQVS